MLGDDDREERLAQRVGLALKRAEAVFKDVQVLRCKRDEPSLGQTDGVLVVRRVVLLGVGDVLRAALQAVLANHHRALLAVLDVLGQEQDAIGDHVREDVHHHFITRVLRLVIDLPRADVRRQQLLVEPADDLGGEELAIRLNRLFIRFE